MSTFAIGDRVYCPNPVNETWPQEYTATVIGVSGDLIDIRWDHGPANLGHLAADLARR